MSSVGPRDSRKDGIKELDKILIIHPANCTGCGICQLVCSMHNYGEYNPKKSYIKLIRNKEAGVTIPTLDINCLLCGRCVEWCPREVLEFVSKEKAVSIMKKMKIGSFPAPLTSSKV
jgi:anaerobic carbon-monoxide dehydrogenase iron sulfur subunit